MKKAVKQSKLISILNTISVIHLVVIIAVFGITAFISNTTDDANNDRYNLTENASYFMGASSYLTSEVRAYAVTGDKQHYDNYIKEFKEKKTRENSIENMKKIGVTAQEQVELEKMVSISNSLISLEEQAIKDVEAGDKTSAILSVLGADYNALITQMNDAKLAFLKILGERTTEKVDRLIFSTRLLEILTIVFIILVVVWQMISYNMIRKRVIAPIIEVEKEMDLVADGNLHSDVSLEPDTSEIGMMIASIIRTKKQLNKYIYDITNVLTQISKQDMSVCIEMDYIGDFRPIKDSIEIIIHAMNSALHNINNTADQVSEGSAQISERAQTLAASTTQQVNSVQQLSQTISKISGKIQSTSEKAKEATNLAEEAGIQLEQSNEQLQGMLNAMNQINDASGEIEKIINTIQNIASQTNTLALNAAIEATRAGEAGKGFSVVAEQVRMLAGQSAEASKNTSIMIKNSLQTIQSGSKIAKEASDTFVSVMSNAEKVSKVMEGIAETAEQQAIDIRQVMQSAEQIVCAVQDNSATSEESASASQQLAEQANFLHMLVQQFKLR